MFVKTRKSGDLKSSIGLRPSRWPGGLRRRSAAAPLALIAGSNPAGSMADFSVVSVVFCQVEVSVTGRSLIQRIPIDCGLRVIACGQVRE